MDCPKCNQVVEAGAAFCGNCGQPIQVSTTTPPPAVPLQQLSVPPSPIAQVMQNQAIVPPTTLPPAGPMMASGNGGIAAGVPNYAITAPGQHAGETKALLAVIFGVISILSALFIPLLSSTLAVAALVLGTLSRSHRKTTLTLVGVIIAGVAILASIGSWAYYSKRYTDTHNPSTASEKISPAVAASDLSTPCYSLGFSSKLNISHAADSCDMLAFNGSNFDSSTDAYKVYANKTAVNNASEFNTVAKSALEKDVESSLVGFTVQSKRVGSFAGSPAYIIAAYNKSQNVAVIEAAVYHTVTTGENTFVFVHGVNDKNVDLKDIEAQWQWK